MGDLYAEYHSEGWQIARQRIGEDLRKQYEVLSEELPPPWRLGEIENRWDDLILAASHVARGHIIVARQRERIARLKALGCSTLHYQQMLNVFVHTLEIFIDHDRKLREGTFLTRKQDDKSRSITRL